MNFATGPGGEKKRPAMPRRPQSIQNDLTVAAAMAVTGSAFFLAVAAGRGVAVGAAAAGLAGRTTMLARASRAACVAFGLLHALEV